MAEPMRWGICSAGKISTDFVTAILSSPYSALNKIEAVATRDKKTAEAFAQKFNIPRAYGSYAHLADDAYIDAVYIGTIHPKHKEFSLLFLNSGKHVLCEKPMAMNLKDVNEVLETAKAKKRFFMEGFWSRTFPLYRKVREDLESGKIGKPLITTGRFLVPITEVDRVFKKELGGSGVLDIGCYLVCITNMVFPGKPVSIKVEGSLFDTGVDSAGAILIRYSCGGVASLTYDTRVDGFESCSNDFVIGGSKGAIRVHPPFWCPTKMTGPCGDEEFPFYPTDSSFNFHNSQGLAYEAEEVRQCIANGLLESPLMTHEDSRTVNAIMEEVLKQLKVSFT